MDMVLTAVPNQTVVCLLCGLCHVTVTESDKHKDIGIDEDINPASASPVYKRTEAGTRTTTKIDIYSAISPRLVRCLITLDNPVASFITEMILG